MKSKDIKSFETGNEYIQEKTLIVKETTKKHIIELNKKSGEKYIQSLLTGKSQKLYFRIKNNNPNRRQNFLSKINNCKSICLSSDKKSVFCRIYKGICRKAPANMHYLIKDYGIKWALRKEDFVEVW